MTVTLRWSPVGPRKRFDTRGLDEHGGGGDMSQLEDSAEHGAAPSSAAYELIEQARRGDEAAWEQLFNEHFPRVYRFFRARVAGAEQAEDLASNVFLQAFRSIEKFNWQGKPFQAWLFGIARNELATYYRALQPTEEMREPTVRDEYLEVEIRDILERLPAEYRLALELRYVIGLSGIEAAAAMDRSHGSFRSLLLRAVRAYRAESEKGAEVTRPTDTRRAIAAMGTRGSRCEAS
jgi:RNA polymerase sigma-70 factor, ECF subfamily